MPVTLPFDIFFTTLGTEHRDQEGRMWLRQRVKADAAGREVRSVLDLMGNASARMALPPVRGTRYPAATLFWDAGTPAQSAVAIGAAEPIAVDAWMKKVGSRSRAFVASDGHTYVWTHTDRIGIWKCTNEAGYVVSEGSDDEYRTITVDQQYPWLGVEILVSFIIMYNLTPRS